MTNVPSLRAAKAEARRLGIDVVPVRRTGEVRFLSPFEDEPPITVNNRRTDSTREVTKLLRRAREVTDKDIPDRP